MNDETRPAPTFSPCETCPRKMEIRCAECKYKRLSDEEAERSSFGRAIAFASANYQRDADPEGAAWLEERESKPEYPNARDCAHGSLRRTCEVCERDERIAELEAECERLRAVVLWYAEYGGTTAIEDDYGKRARAALKGRG